MSTPGSPSTAPNSASPGPDRPPDGRRTPIAAVGASAGGLQALKTFFEALVPDPGMAFVVLMHPSPEHESSLSEIIGQYTTLSVQTPEGGTTPEANVAYVLPPKKELGIDGGRFRLADAAGHEDQPTVIDTFFGALAADQGENAIGIVLSGPGTDGTQGLRVLKEAGGVTMVQAPEEAVHDGTPRSAMPTSLVDVVAPAERLAAQLSQFGAHPVSESRSEEAEVPPEEGESSEHVAQLEDELEASNEALQRREQSLQVLSKAVEEAKEAVLITEATPLDEPGPRIVYVNSAFEKQTGYAEREVLGTTPRILQGAETDREVLNSLRSALEAGEEWEGETVNYRKDGSPYVVQWNIAPVRGEDGSVEYWVSVQRDVTETRRRERALRRQKNLLEQTQRLAGAWEVDLRSGEVSWSDEVYRIHEVEPGAEIEVNDQVEFYAPEARPKIREAFERCVDEGEPYDLELPLDTATGNRRWVRTVGAPVEKENGTVIKVAGALQDITERKQALRQAREERNFVNALLNTVGALVLVTDRDGRIVRFNEECEAVTGYSAEAVVGIPFLDLLVPPDERDQVAEEFAKLKKGAEPRSHENHWQTKDGERRLIRWSSTVLTGDDGDVEYVVGTGIDITERRRLEREVIAASDETRRQIGEDLHDMLASHLAGTAMMADTLAENLGEKNSGVAEKIREITELIREAGEQARTLSHSLMPLEVKNDELEDGLQKLADRQEQMGEFTCTFGADESLPSLRGEVASHLYRIVSEAVGNAAKHANPETIEIRLRRADDRLVLTVRDDGVGIPAELETTDGLGLHTMKYRAELIGATLDVGPAAEGGTVVRCRLPLTALSEPDETPEPVAPA